MARRRQRTGAGVERPGGGKTRINRDYVLDEMMVVEVPQASDTLCRGAFLAFKGAASILLQNLRRAYITRGLHGPSVTKTRVSQQSPGRTYVLLVEITADGSWHSLRRYFVQLLIGVENSLSSWFWFLFWDPLGCDWPRYSVANPFIYDFLFRWLLSCPKLLIPPPRRKFALGLRITN